jgi:hypothetical protein
VLRDAVDRRDQGEQCQHLDPAPKQHGQPIGRNEGLQSIDGMETTGVEPVEARRAAEPGSTPARSWPAR